MSKSRSYLSITEKEQIIQLFTEQKLNPTHIGKLIGRCNKTVYDYLHKTGYKTPTLSESKKIYHIHDDYFDIIDTEDKAYTLGFIYADGCNYEPKSNIIIALQEKDKHILEKFSSNLYLKHKELQYVTVLKTGKNTTPQYRLSFISQHMSKKLAEIGCVNNKTLRLTFPKKDIIPEHLIHHFIRGYFDGDGWIGNKGAQVLSTRNFLQGIQEVLKNINIHSGIRISKPKSANILTCTLDIGGVINIEKLYNYLYKDATIYLNRKYDKYIEFKRVRSIPKVVKYCIENGCITKSRVMGYCRKHFYKYYKNKIDY